MRVCIDININSNVSKVTTNCRRVKITAAAEPVTLNLIPTVPLSITSLIISFKTTLQMLGLRQHELWQHSLGVGASKKRIFRRYHLLRVNNIITYFILRISYVCSISLTLRLLLLSNVQSTCSVQWVHGPWSMDQEIRGPRTKDSSFFLFWLKERRTEGKERKGKREPSLRINWETFVSAVTLFSLLLSFIVLEKLPCFDRTRVTAFDFHQEVRNIFDHRSFCRFGRSIYYHEHHTPQ